MTPQLGDFGVQSGGGWGGFLIRLGTFGRYGHAAVIVSTDPLAIVEATPGGARRRACRPDEFVWSRCPLTEEQREGICGDALACVGLGYGWASIVGFVLRFWGAKIRGRSDDHADGTVICSEIAAWAYRRWGHELADPQVAPGDVSPNDLADHITRERP